MNAYEAVRVALMGLLGNKVRSFLTMLGVIIGVAAVIIVVAIGQGLKADTMERIQKMGTNLLTIRPGSSSRTGVASETAVINLIAEDATEIQNNVKNIQAVAPDVSENTQAKYRSNNMRSTILGTTPEYQTAHNMSVAEGRFFTDAEVRGRKRVCAIGSEVYDELFDGRQAVGEWIRIGGIPFEVIGVMAELGGAFGRPDQQVMAPLTTVQTRVLGRDDLSSISVSASTAEAVDQVEKDIEVLLRRRHKLRTGQDNDFRTMKQSMILEDMAAAGETMTRLLGAIAMVSLLVGGVGIMNIMLVSVSERTREIGIRKAIGARKVDILWQFLIESVVLSVIGGGIGIGIGLGVCHIITTRAGWTAIVSPSSIIYAFVFSAFVGIFFGIWPAKKGAEMDPIEALRHE